MNSRKVALDVLLDVSQGAYSNIALNKHLKSIRDKRDRALITEMVYGILRLQNRLDYIIKKFSNISINKIEQVVLLALRIGIYQICFLDKIPARAAVNETVNSIKKISNKGAVGFLNGVLRKILREKDEINFPDPESNIKSYLVDYLSHPAWLVDYWINIYGLDKTIELCKYNNEPADLRIRINRLKYSEEDFLNTYKKENMKIIPGRVPQSYIIKDNRGVELFPLYREGGFLVQGSAATLAVQIMNPEPGIRVLDMAAAPGGKTTHIAELMDNQGEIIALDIYEHKLSLIEENSSRLGIEIIKTVNSDSKNYYNSKSFDMVLLDAPCSGLGLIKQKPEIRWNKEYINIKYLAGLQFEMLKNALNLLKKDGILLYSTCTLTKEENQRNIEKILKLYKDALQLMDISVDLKRLGLNEIFKTDKMGLLELFPTDNKTEGFFIAKLKKI